MTPRHKRCCHNSCRATNLSRANARLYAAELTANEFVGPPLAGFLVAAGAAIAFGVPAVLWVTAVAALVLAPGRFRIQREQETTIRAEIAEGLRFLWGHELLRAFSVMVGVFNFATNATFAIFILYAVGAESVMGLSEPGFGFLFATVAAGSLFGSFAAEWFERALGRARSLVLTIVAASSLVGIPAVTDNPYLIGTVFFVGGASIAVWNIIVLSLRQRITPNRLLGRVNAGHRLVAWGTRPIGAAAGGILAQVLGLRPVFVIMSLVIFALLLSMRMLSDDAMDAAERAAVKDP